MSFISFRNGNKRFRWNCFGLKVVFLIPFALGWGESVRAQQSEVPIKNFREWPYALESVTNVSRNRDDLKRFYQRVITTYPKRGTLDELNLDFLFSNFGYSSFFCRRMILSDSETRPENRWLHSNFDFLKAPQEQAMSSWHQVMDEYSRLFWARELRAEERVILIEMVENLLGDFLVRQQSNVDVLLGVCVAFSNSFEFVLK